MSLTLFHGGNLEYLERVLSYGFNDNDRYGNGFGLTYGTGFYFTTDPEVARCYSDTDTILKITCVDNFYCIDHIAGYPTRKSQKKFDKLQREVSCTFIGFKKRLNGEDEYILFESNYIDSKCIVK